MISIVTNCTGIENELGELIRLFFREGVVYAPQEGAARSFLHLRVETENGYLHRMWEGGALLAEYREVSIGAITGKRLIKYCAKLCVYRGLQRATGRTQPWGSLTGVRPVKMLNQLDEMGLMGDTVFQETFGVSADRAALSRAILSVQSEMAVPKGSIGIYIGIPFCVSRCSYCSFPGIVAKEPLHQQYLDALLMELDAAAGAVSKKGIPVNSVYIGGGTPTSLNEALLDRLLNRVHRSFPGVELTLEAGRPDTITREKLNLAKAYGVTRLCINPQTMNETTLNAITRSHSIGDIVASYALARELGFDHINADLIAGLEGESLDDFCNTIEETLKLNPESITVHTLALKRGSRLKDTGYTHTREEKIAGMVDYARTVLTGNGYRPYYLYRQKYMAGNLENVGYALPGKECLYNVCMMDDLSSVLALGEGAISKIITGDRIQRYPNPKDIRLYLERIGEICVKYEGILALTKNKGCAYN